MKDWAWVGNTIAWIALLAFCAFGVRECSNNVNAENARPVPTRTPWCTSGNKPVPCTSRVELNKAVAMLRNEIKVSNKKTLVRAMQEDGDDPFSMNDYDDNGPKDYDDITDRF